MEAKQETTAAIVRTARPRDAAAVNAIQSHYIDHTTKTIWYEPFPVEDTRSKIQSAAADGYPFLIAESTSGPESVLGYACLSRFRLQDGWFPTAEVSLFVHHAHRGVGIGSRLLRHLIAAARAPSEAAESQSGRDTDAPAPGLLNLLAVVAMDGDDVVGFYRRFGFRVVGIVEKGGWKFGGHLDVMFLQLSV